MLTTRNETIPAQEAGRELSTYLELYKNNPVLLLLAGGSALHVLEYTDTKYIAEQTTIMMMDDRFSSAPEENNFLQMTKTFFYTKLTNSQCNFIPTVPETEEEHVAFSERIEAMLTRYIEANPEATIIALFGIGTDGHTAAIFPMPHEDFIDTYGQGRLYTNVVYSQNQFENRCSITPKFITQYVNHSLIYAVGEEKRVILEALHEPYELHELPAYIHHQIGSTLFTDLEL